MFRQAALNLKSLFTPKNILLGLTSISLYNIHRMRRRTDRSLQCCGVIGVITVNKDAGQICMQGLQLLKNRGYDSAGISGIDPTTGQMQTFKYAGYGNMQTGEVDCVQKLFNKLIEINPSYQVAIGHTRWATCGSKTDINAHPHLDQDNRIALVHNGTLDNEKELRQELIDQHVKLVSETDSELIAQFIGLQVKSGKDLFEATTEVCTKKIRGTWGLAIIDRDNPQQIVVSSFGSPLHIGFHKDMILIASEIIAFTKYTQNYITVESKEIISLDINNRESLYDNKKARIQFVEVQTPVQMFPGKKYKFWFDQEISQQPESILKVMGNGGRLSDVADTCKLGGLEQHTTEIKSIENLLILACGTSFFAGQLAARFFRLLSCFNTVTVLEASEFELSDLPQHDCGVLFLSQSGETYDLTKIGKILQERSVFMMGIINTVGSTLATMVNCGIYLNCGREVAVPATKSFSCQVVALIMMAIWISHEKGVNDKKQLRIDLKQELRQLPTLFGVVLKELEVNSKKVAQILQNEESIYILGKGVSSYIAKEGALKIKETTYIHAEALCAGEMKHGSIALVNSEQGHEKQTKIILIILDDVVLGDMLTTLSTMFANKAYTIVITNCKEKIPLLNVDFLVEVPKNLHLLTPLLVNVFFQRLSLEICSLKQLNPDQPRNLAKTVTVK